MANLVEQIKEAAMRGERMYLSVCTVDKIDEQQRTIDCTPVDDGAQLLDVQLQANTSLKSGFVAFPEAGSEVIIGYIDPANAAMLCASSIAKIEIACENIVFNSGERGMVKIKELGDKLKALENKLNDHTHIVPTGGVSVTTANGAAANPAPINIPAMSGKSAEFQSGYSDFEDEKIKH
jgi:hypothetical protein